MDSLNVIIPDGTEYIGYRQFERSNIRSVVIPGSVKEIDNDAFCECKFLENVELAEGLECIGSNAFGHCPSLKAIKLPHSLKYIWGHAFGLCGLEEITIPKVDVWSFCTFNRCQNLKKVTISEGITEIPSYTFYHCKSLTVVCLPKSVKEICDYAFSGCPNLTIRAPKGSEAEEYAKEEGIQFKEL